ncbi:MAG: FMN-binding negative transcriptional regulator [Paracoccus sp. (in: a-proteobacteria)]
MMYCPPAFAESRTEIMAELIRANPLGLLITSGESGPDANPVPFNLTPDGRYLRTHLARANPQLTDLAAGVPALIVFQGEQAYVSPDWYPSKHETGRAVPTWNYLMVQIRGDVSLSEDTGWLRNQIETMTHQMEAARPTPWAVSDAPDKYITLQLRGIIGVEVDIREMRGKWKASQNKAVPDRVGVGNALRATHPALSTVTHGVT